MAVDKLLNMQGEFFLAERDVAGNPVQPFATIGDASAAELSASQTELIVKENRSGFRRTIISATTSSELSLSITFRDFKAENLALFMLGLVVAVAQTVVTGEPFPDAIIAGQSFKLDKKGKVSALTIVDSTNVPVTVTNTKYASDGYGFVTFLDVTGYTQPFKANYTAGAVKRIPLVTVAPPERALLMRGVNTLEVNSDGTFKRKELNLRRVKFKAAETLALLQEENAVATIPIKADVLADPFIVASTSVSPYGDWFDLDA